MLILELIIILFFLNSVNASCATSNIDFDTAGACVGISTYILIIILALIVLLILCCCCSSLRNNFAEAIKTIICCPCMCFGFIAGDQDTALVYNSNTSRFCMIFFVSFGLLIASVGVLIVMLMVFGISGYYSTLNTNYANIAKSEYNAAISTNLTLANSTLFWLNDSQIISLNNPPPLTSSSIQQSSIGIDVAVGIIFGIPFLVSIPFLCLSRDLGKKEARFTFCCCYLIGAIFFLGLGVFFIVVLSSRSSFDQYYVPGCTNPKFSANLTISGYLRILEALNCIKLGSELLPICNSIYFICTDPITIENYTILSAYLPTITPNINTTNETSVTSCAVECSGYAKNSSIYILEAELWLASLSASTKLIEENSPCTVAITNSTPNRSFDLLVIILLISASFASIIFFTCAISASGKSKEIFFEGVEEAEKREPAQRTRMRRIRSQN
jgi:hypothetical protein